MKSIRAKTILPTIYLFLLIFPFPGNAAWIPNQNLPIPVRRLLMDVREAMTQKDFQGAIQKITSFHTRDKADSAASCGAAGCRHPLVCFALGNCYLMTSDYKNAETAYQRVLEAAPDFIDARINLAKVYNDTQQHEKAAQCFLAAYTKSDPKNPDFLYYSAISYLMGSQQEQAIPLFEKLFTVHAEAVLLLWKENYANALMMTHRWKQAEPIVRQLAQQTRGDQKIRWQETLLQIYLQTNETAQALSLATNLSRSDCTVAKWWKALVHIHLSLGQYREALSCLLIYGYRAPLSARERKLCADLCLQLEIPHRAALEYESILKENPDPQVLKRLVAAYRQLGQSQKALAAMKPFEDKEADPEFWMLKADLLYAEKRYNDADAAYRMAAQKDFDRAGQAWLMAGYASWQQNDFTASRQAFKQAAGFKRYRKNAIAAIKQIEKKE